MTDPAPGPARRRAVARVPAPAVTIVGASVVFLGALGGIGVQMATGHDPALGVARSTGATSTERAPGAPRVARPRAAAATAGDEPGVVQRPEPVVRTASPVPSATAPVPAPSPVQTTSS